MVQRSEVPAPRGRPERRRPAGVDQVLALQRSAGNHAVQRIVAPAGASMLQRLSDMTKGSLAMIRDAGGPDYTETIGTIEGLRDGVIRDLAAFKVKVGLDDLHRNCVAGGWIDALTIAIDHGSNSLRLHLSEEDMSGALRDKHGIPVRVKATETKTETKRTKMVSPPVGQRFYDHRQEVLNSYATIENLNTRLITDANQKKTGNQIWAELTTLHADLDSFFDAAQQLKRQLATFRQTRATFT